MDGDAAERLAAAVAAAAPVGVEELRRFLARAEDAYDDGGSDERYAVRAALGRVERALVGACRFAEADAFCRLRLELSRREYRRQFRERRDLSSLVRAWTYGLWRFTSHYGTSPLRLGWTVFNVAFWFSVLYFALDVVALRTEGRHAYAATATISYASYFIIGFEGLFPGTAVILANTYPAQVALALENALGAVLIVSLVTLVGRRIWRGVG